MGIDGLLNLLKPIAQKQHISTFKGKIIAVDAMPWIYKGCYSCAMKLNQNIQSIDFLYYILEMIDMLSYYSIKPIFIFDGRSISAKNDTLDKRKKDKQENKQKGLQFLKNNQMKEAKKYLSRCIIIDERIIAMTINCLITKNVQFIVAPYEADCQIAKLKRLGIIDGAITQDSDLIIFGVNVILKLNQNGQCDYIDLSKWRPRDVDDVFLKYYLAFDELSKVDAAILAGSDYNNSVRGIGIKRAIKLLTTQVTIPNVLNKLKYTKTYMDRIPQDYEKKVERSKLIFNLSTCYNPLEKKLEFLRPELLSQLKPEQMTLQQLYGIVGIHYEYTDDVVNGKVSSKTLEKRQLKILDFNQLFHDNKENWLAHEALIKKKKIQDEKLQKQLQMANDNQINPDQEIFNQLKQFRTNITNPLELTQEQKQNRRQERKKRINKLQEVMNSLVDDMFGSSSDEDEVIQSDKESDDYVMNKIEEKVQNIERVNLSQNKKIHETTIKSSKKKRDYSDSDDYAQQQNSVSDDLQFLNPFAKKEIKPVALKPQHIHGSKKK